MACVVFVSCAHSQQQVLCTIFSRGHCDFVVMLNGDMYVLFSNKQLLKCNVL
jgi:hypothetical protein